MEEKKKKGNPAWKPGVSGNPKGQAAVPPEIKAAREFNKNEFTSRVNKFIYMPFDELLEYLERRAEIEAIDTIIINLIINSNRDERALKLLLERMLGKVEEKINITTSFHAQLVEWMQKKKVESE